MTVDDEDLGDPTEDPDGEDDDTALGDGPGAGPPQVSALRATPAPACRAALAQATQRWPRRNRAADGIMGDARHCAKPNPTSDHCTGNAFDLTDDPANGCDAHALMEKLRVRRDPRVKYVISDGRIWNPSISPAWRHYDGSNPHVAHAHVSILRSARDDTSPWWDVDGRGEVSTHPPPASLPAFDREEMRQVVDALPILQPGDRGPHVGVLQGLLHANRRPVTVDDHYGPLTERALREWKRSAGLDANPVVDGFTWRALLNLRW